MLANHSHERLLALRLTGMAKAFDDQLRQPDIDKLSFEQRLGLMIDRETTERDNRRLVTRLKFAALRQTAVIEDIDLRASRGIDRSFLARLVDGDWIARWVSSIARSRIRSVADAFQVRFMPASSWRRPAAAQ